MDDALAARARRLIAGSLAWDNHACMPLRPGDDSFLPQIERARTAGFDVVSLNIGFGPQSLEAHLRMLASLRRWFAARPDLYALPRSAADIDQARAEGRLSVIFDVEGMAPLDHGDHGLVQMLYDLGVRWMLIAYNRNNAAGGGCYDDDPGLSAHGRAVLDEMRRVGMVVCCSHTGHRTARDVLDHGGGPVIFSHSNASAIHPHARNIPDDLIRACARTGGVVGINGIGAFLGAGEDWPELLARHVDHVVQLVGPDHAGVALDYVYDQDELAAYLTAMRETFPGHAADAGDLGMAPPEALEGLTARLLHLGYEEADVAKVLGGNWLRIARQVWR